MGPPNNAMPKVSEYDDDDNVSAAKGLNNNSSHNQSKYSSNTDPLADILGKLLDILNLHTYTLTCFVVLKILYYYILHIHTDICI